MLYHDGLLSQPKVSIGQKLLHLHWLFVILLTLTASIGFAMLYSAAGGDFDPWASRQMVRFGVGMLGMVVIAVTDIRFWLRYAYAFYVLVLVLLLGVELAGFVGMGAQRWISLGFFNIQPSELMKIAMVLALARYFHGGSIEDVGRPMFLLPPAIMVAVPAVLIIRQPDLGTTLMLLLASVAIFFAAGVRMWKFILAGVLGLISAPVAWFTILRDYQKQRILTFLNPESDTLGSGYHIIQSKIALGSGGMFGKGFMQGTQSHLNFLPEKQTDFIFTMLAEEFGLVGGLTLIALYVLLLAYGFVIAMSSRNHFGRLVGIGVTVTFFLYIFINIAMVMGLIPVVGVPLPLVSYGGTAMLTILFGFGLLLCVHIHQDLTIGRRDSGDEF
ncbi:rod shape-determining protein RodA [Magnetovibrio sp.]|uniref:rod shape-determining protein RodA n=1 Tax=Magnetovibrio sp. TaxID=2024836 RepID=UPI002F93009E